MTYPAPDGWQDRCRYHGKDNEIITQNWNKLPSPLRSELPTPLPSRDSDVNSDVKGEGEDAAASAFNAIKTHIEQLTGIPAAPQSIPAIDEFVKMGATPEDITAGYNWRKGEGLQVKYYSQLVGPTRVAMSKRRGENGRSTDKYPDEPWLEHNGKRVKPSEIGYVNYNGEWRDPRNVPTEISS